MNKPTFVKCESQRFEEKMMALAVKAQLNPVDDDELQEKAKKLNERRRQDKYRRLNAQKTIP